MLIKGQACTVLGSKPVSNLWQGRAGKTSAKVQGMRGKTERGSLSVVFSLFVGARHVSPLFSLLTPENFADFSLRFYFSLFTDCLIRRKSVS